jgi:WD40 repeat protein
LSLFSALQFYTKLGRQSCFIHYGTQGNGDLLITGEQDGMLRVWDINTGNEVENFVGAEGRVYAVAYSPDGTLIAAASDNFLRLLTGSGDVVREHPIVQIVPSTHEGPFAATSLSFNSNGTDLAISTNDRVTRVFDTSTGELKLEVPGRHSGFSHDVLVIGGENGLYLWDVESEMQIGSYESDEPLIHLAVNENSSVFVARWQPIGLRVIDISDPSHPVLLREAPIWPSDFALDAQGEQMAGIEDGLLVLRSLPELDIISQVRHTYQGIGSVIFRGSGQLVIGDLASNLWLRDVLTETETPLIQYNPLHDSNLEQYVSLAYDSATDHVALGLTDGSVSILDLADGNRTEVFPEDFGADFRYPGGFDILFISGQQTILSSGSSLRVHDLSTGTNQLILDRAASENQVRSLTSSQSGDLFAYINNDDIYLRSSPDIAQPQQILSSPQEGSRILDIDLSHDGSLLAIGYVDALYVWNMETNQIMWSVAIDQVAQLVEFNSDSTLLVTSGQESPVRVWDVAEAELVMELNEPVDGTSKLMFSPDGHFLLALTPTDLVYVWGIPAGE